LTAYSALSLSIPVRKVQLRSPVEKVHSCTE
jgi:hypothetical protein